jgi:hypothetical protein
MAKKVAAMTLGRAAAHRERLAAQAALLERLADMPLEELSRPVNRAAVDGGGFLFD